MQDRTENLLEALKTLILEKKANTQEELCVLLEKQGFEINQTKVSRLLRKIGATKILNNEGQITYSFPKEPSPPSMDSTLSRLILSVEFNEFLIIITTVPGSASMIARFLDFQKETLEILGTLAGDDTIFIAPKSVKNISKLVDIIKKSLVF